MELLSLVSRRWRSPWSTHPGRHAMVPALEAAKAEEKRPVRRLPAGGSLRPRWLRGRCRVESSSWKPSLGSISEDGSFLCADAEGRVGSGPGRSAAAAARKSRDEAMPSKKRSLHGAKRGGSSSTRNDSYRRDFSCSAMSVMTPALVPAPFLF